MSADHPDPNRRRSRIAARVVSSALLVVAVGACSGPPSRTVLVVTVDGLAAASTAQGLATLAAEGATFRWAFTAASTPASAHASWITGRFAGFHTVGPYAGLFPLHPSETTLAERLAEAGWRTGAFLADPALDAALGLDQGFATYDTPHRDGAEHGTAEVVDRAIAWFGKAEERSADTFLWVGLRVSGKADVDATLAAELGRLLAAMPVGKENGGATRPLVILTSGHGPPVDGEAAGASVALTEVHVPLLASGPGLAAGSDVDRPVSTVAVFPTVLAFAGLDEGADADAFSLVGIADGSETRAMPIHFESYDQIGLVYDNSFLRRDRLPADAELETVAPLDPSGPPPRVAVFNPARLSDYGVRSYRARAQLDALRREAQLSDEQRSVLDLFAEIGQPPM